MRVLSRRWARVVLAVGVTGLVVLSPAGAAPAYALGGIPVPVIVPASTAGTAVLGAAAGSGELLAGAAALGFGLGYYGSKFLYSQFGPSGDARTSYSGLCQSSLCVYTAYTVPAVGPISGNPATFQVVNGNASANGSSAYGAVTFTWGYACRVVATGVVSVYLATVGQVINANSAMTFSASNCGTGGQLAWMKVWKDTAVNVSTAPTTSAPLWTWVYDPPAPWTLTTTVTCKNAAGATTSLVNTGTSFTPTASQVLSIPVSVTCPDALVGSHPDQVVLSGGRAGEVGTLLTIPTFNATAVSSYPNCTSSAPVGGCQLVLLNSGVSCFASGVDCSSWQTSNDHGTYACKWGAYDVPMSMCAAEYPATSFAGTATVTPSPTPAPTTAPVTGTPGSATTLNPDGSSTSSTTSTLPDGTTQTVTQTTALDGSTTTTTTVRTTAGTVVSTATVTSPATRPLASGADADSGCSFGLKPWLWPFRALTCAFVPSSATMPAAWSTVNAGWTGTRIPAWGSALGGVGTSLSGIGSGAAGCAGPHFAFTLKGHAYAFDPLNACGDPMRGVAVVVKLFATIAVVVAGARFCARPLMAAIGMGEAV